MVLALKSLNTERTSESVSEHRCPVTSQLIQAAETALPTVASGARFLLQGCALKQGLGVQ